MSRSNYKLPYLHKSVFPHIIENKVENDYKLKFNEDLLLKKNVEHCFFFFKRNSRIDTNLIGKKIAVYNGCVFIIYNVVEDSIDFKLGEFSVTRKKPNHAGKVKQKKKVEKVQKLAPGEIAGSIRISVRKPKTLHKKKKGSLKKKKARVGKKHK